jgi:hypothetical protein
MKKVGSGTSNTKVHVMRTATARCRALIALSSLAVSTIVGCGEDDAPPACTVAADVSRHGCLSADSPYFDIEGFGHQPPPKGVCVNDPTTLDLPAEGEVVIAVHLTTTFDRHYITARAAEDFVCSLEGRSNAVLVELRADDEGDYFIHDEGPHYTVYSFDGKLAFPIPSRSVTLIGGHLSMCLNEAIGDVLAGWNDVQGDLKLTLLAPAVYIDKWHSGLGDTPLVIASLSEALEELEEAEQVDYLLDWGQSIVSERVLDHRVDLRYHGRDYSVREAPTDGAPRLLVDVR